MTTELTQEQERVVQRQRATGRFSREDNVISEALALLEQDHRGIKGHYRGMRSFRNFNSPAQFCDAYDGLRDFLRLCSRPYEVLSLSEQRSRYLARTQTLMAAVGGT